MSIIFQQEKMSKYLHHIMSHILLTMKQKLKSRNHTVHHGFHQLLILILRY